MMVESVCLWIQPSKSLATLPAKAADGRISLDNVTTNLMKSNIIASAPVSVGISLGIWRQRCPVCREGRSSEAWGNCGIQNPKLAGGCRGARPI